jgi:transposase-like protein
MSAHKLIDRRIVLFGLCAFAFCKTSRISGQAASIRLWAHDHKEFSGKNNVIESDIHKKTRTMNEMKRAPFRFIETGQVSVSWKFNMNLLYSFYILKILN